MNYRTGVTGPPAHPTTTITLRKHPHRTASPRPTRPTSLHYMALRIDALLNSAAKHQYIKPAKGFGDPPFVHQRVPSELAGCSALPSRLWCGPPNSLRSRPPGRGVGCGAVVRGGGPNGARRAALLRSWASTAGTVPSAAAGGGNQGERAGAMRVVRSE